jgi:hypothetical protein
LIHDGNMKRKLLEDDRGIVVWRTADIDWDQEDRQPDWQDAVGIYVQGSDDEDGDDLILESRRRQQRLVTPEASECGEPEPPGAPTSKRRRLLPWTKEGRERWPSLSTAVIRRGADKKDAVVLVEDSAVESEGDDEDEDEDEDDSAVEDSVAESEGDEDEDDLSSFVVEDDSSSVADEESASERSLGEDALREVRTQVVNRILKMQQRLVSVDRELDALSSVERQTERDRLSLAASRRRGRYAICGR